MRIALVHNTYQQSGGEDSVVCAEKDLLLRKGHEVIEYRKDNNEIELEGICSQITLGMRTVWSFAARSELYGLLKSRKPDVVHFHNTFPLISPSGYYACRDMGIPIVQTLHNYRLFCSAASFYRDGKVCEECIEKNRWHAIRHACYRESRSATAAVASMLTFHHWCGTWRKLVDCYIALSEFSRAKFIEAGLPAEKIIVKPNFIFPNPAINRELGQYAVFVGRFSEEKGLDTLLQAWSRVGTDSILRLIGDGPLLHGIRNQICSSQVRNVFLHGRLSRSESLNILRASRFVILPSECYENFPMTIAESYACGKPVITSRLGAMQEIVHEGRTGLLFNPGDPDDLFKKIQWAWTHPELMQDMGRNARAEFETKYTAEQNYRMLVASYESVLASRKAGSGAALLQSASS